MPAIDPIFIVIFDAVPDRVENRLCAQLLGFADHAAFMLAGKMAGTTGAVETFIDGITAKLRPQAEAQLDALLAVKQADTGDAADSAFYRWDSRFYDRIQKETTLSIDEAKVAEFFPMDHVLAEIMAIYSEVLGLTFARARRLGRVGLHHFTRISQLTHAV